jgi:hypothetical protein
MKKVIFGIALIAGIVVLAVFERFGFATALGFFLYLIITDGDL